MSLSYVKTVARAILKALNWKRVTLSILFVDDRTMRRYNRQYLRHDRTTDVMAFGHLDHDDGVKKNLLVSDAPFLGDILISLPMAKRQAAQYGNSLRYEISYYLCHGILHLMGYEDKKKKDAVRMARKQQRILKAIGVKNRES